MDGYIITYPDCILDEVVPAQELLQRDHHLQTIDLNEIDDSISADFILIPGGSCDLAVEHRALHRFIQRTKASKGIVAGICNGALVLASAGVLKDEKCTHTAVPKYAPLPEFKLLLEVAGREFRGSTFIDEDVVVSGQVVTAKPWAAQKFADTVANRLRARASLPEAEMRCDTDC